MITKSDLQGHWRRDWIKAPGFEDHTTRVHWMQAGDLFADLRVPLARPDLGGARCLAELSEYALAALMASEGFAGTIDVTDSRCTWRREVNWHGVPEADDIGLMYVDGDALIEDGVLAEYRERWLAEPGPALRGHRVALGALSGVLVESDETFLIALGAPPEAHSPDPANHFSSTYCLGRWEGARGIATLSTNPFCEGTCVLTRGAVFTWHGMRFDGSVVSGALT